MSPSRVALVHDYFLQRGGAERVVELWAKHFPSARIYSSAINFEMFPDLLQAQCRTSILQNVPILKSKFKWFFPFYGTAFRNMCVSGADVALVSSSAYAHHISVRAGIQKIWYCHNPPRFLWRSEEYLKYETSSPFVKGSTNILIRKMRRSDLLAAKRVDTIIANSSCVRERIWKTYGVDADVVFPPVRVDQFSVSNQNDGFLLVVSRLVGYKRIDRAIEGVRGTNIELRIIGGGPDLERLKGLAGSNVKFLGRVSDEEVVEQMRQCKALVFPGVEDFGITPVEANACGKPVLAYEEGGALDTIIEGQNGVFFNEKGSKPFAAAMAAIYSTKWDTRRIRELAERFTSDIHMDKMAKLVGFSSNRSAA